MTTSVKFPAARDASQLQELRVQIPDQQKSFKEMQDLKSPDMKDDVNSRQGNAYLEDDDQDWDKYCQDNRSPKTVEDESMDPWTNENSESEKFDSHAESHKAASREENMSENSVTDKNSESEKFGCHTKNHKAESQKTETESSEAGKGIESQQCEGRISKSGQDLRLQDIESRGFEDSETDFRENKKRSENEVSENEESECRKKPSHAENASSHESDQENGEVKEVESDTQVIDSEKFENEDNESAKIEDDKSESQDFESYKMETKDDTRDIKDEETNMESTKNEDTDCKDLDNHDTENRRVESGDIERQATAGEADSETEEDRETTADSKTKRPRDPEQSVTQVQEESFQTLESEETCQERHIGFRSIEARKSSAGKAELLAEITRLENHNRAIRIHWQEEVEEFARKEAKQKSKETQLLAEIQHLRDARHQREYAGVEDLEGQLYQERQNAWNWQSKVQEIQNMKLFIDDHCPRPKPLELEIIEDAVNIIGTGIQSLLHRCDAGTSEHIPLIRRNSDLESLFRSLVPTKLSIGQMQRLVPKQIAKWGLPIAIRGLTTAALKDWVFESDFPNFSRNGDPRMLEEYRSIILNFAGRNRLHNLEIAAYHALTSSSYFKNNFIPRKADEYTSRLSIALAPFFTSSTEQPDTGDFDSWGQDHNTSENRRFCLREIFETALKLKAQTVLTDEEYEFVLHPLGSAEEPNPSKSGDDTTVAEKTLHDRFKTLLHASFKTYRRTVSGSRDKMEDALVRTENFSSRRTRGGQEPLNTYSLTSVWIEGLPKQRSITAAVSPSFKPSGSIPHIPSEVPRKRRYETVEPLDTVRCKRQDRRLDNQHLRREHSSSLHSMSDHWEYDDDVEYEEMSDQDILTASPRTHGLHRSKKYEEMGKHASLSVRKSCRESKRPVRLIEAKR